VNLLNRVARALVCACAFFLGCNLAEAQPISFSVSFWYPTNGESYVAPANIGVHAMVTDSNVVETVQYLVGTNSIGIVTNKGGVLITNSNSESPFFVYWTNVPVGTYTLTAVATDSAGNMATSAPVTITVTKPPPPPPPVPFVYIYSPTNGSVYHAPTNVTMYVRAGESGGAVASVEFFENKTLLGVVSNSGPATNISSEPLYSLTWSNVPTGAFALQAIAIDTNGNSASSSVVSITVYPPPPNVPLAVAISFPTNGQSYIAPATVPMRASVADSNVVQTVQYYSGTNSIGIVTNHSGLLLTNITAESPFLFDWTNVPAGTYTLTALAVDTAGHTTTSASVTITVTPAPPPVPYVYIYSPANGSTYHAPTNVILYAHAGELGGAVASVEFFENKTLLGVVSNTSVATNISSVPLYSLIWSNVPTGTIALQAVVIDTNGNTATSSVVIITVYPPPPPPPNIPLSISFWYPTNGETYFAPADIGIHAAVADSNVVETVQYFSGTNSIGIVTNKGGVLLTNISGESPFYLDWTNVPAGTYSLTAVATDSAGNMATSAPVTITVTPPPPLVPYVYIYSPMNGSVYHAPTNITIFARAVDIGASGTKQLFWSNIISVEFFENNTLLGTASNSSMALSPSSEPLYSLTWSNVPTGTFALRAVAIDTNGNSATSSVVSITVVSNPPPPNIPLAVSIWYPTNGESYVAPASIGIRVGVADSNVVETVQFFSGTNSLGIVTNKGGVLLTNLTAVSPFYLYWTNVSAGKYTVTAVATDSAANMATSAPVTITVTAPPPPVPYVYIFTPTNGSVYHVPTNITIFCARV